VWAPAPERVCLEVDGEEIPLERGSDGWWRPVQNHHGSYWFVVDGERLPDPRSPWQPDGIRGSSHTVDHSAFAWTDQSWHGLPLASAVLYELHVGTFSPEGTFDGVISRLDHLVDLGVNAIELLPVAEFPGRRGWGYDGVLLYAPHHGYGGPEGLKRLVDAAHGRGLAVVLDVVYNHLGPSGNHLARFGPYFTDRYRTPWGDAVNLDDRGSDEVRRYFCDNAVGWIRDYHLDGLRLDAVHALADRSAIHFLEQLAGEVHNQGDRLGRQVWVIAESDLNDPRLVRPVEAGGYGLDASWSDDFHHALHVLFTGERGGYYAAYEGMADLARALERVYVHDGRYDASRGRTHGRPVGNLRRNRFLGYSQNHDQIGNRARGERLSQLVEPEALGAIAALVLTAPFVPMLFQGEEWGSTSPFLYVTDHDDPELAEAVRQGRRAEFAAFGWDPEQIPDPQSPDSFAASVLDWDSRLQPPHSELLTWYRRLLRLRREHPEFTATGPEDTRVRFDVQRRWLAVERGGFAIAVNLAGHAQLIARPPSARRVLGTYPDHPVVLGPDGLQLPPGTVAIMGPDDHRA
jgi:maltooligosyltrehalose trehalohydrolase